MRECFIERVAFRIIRRVLDNCVVPEEFEALICVRLSLQNFNKTIHTSLDDGCHLKVAAVTFKVCACACWRKSGDEHRISHIYRSLYNY